MKKVDWNNKETIAGVISKSNSFRETLTNLGISIKGSNNATLKKWIKLHELDISHFADARLAAIKHLHKVNTIPVSEIIDGKHPQYPTYHLKQRLLKEGILENVCGECGQVGTWNNKPLNMQLDHINGISNDHNISNIRMLCPNCHTQTETFAGKNRQKL